MEENTINLAFEALHTATIEYNNRSAVLANLEADLGAKKSTGLANGSIEGKNAELREAAALEFLRNEYNAVAVVDRKFRDAKLNLDIARIEVERIKTILRLFEVSE